MARTSVFSRLVALRAEDFLSSVFSFLLSEDPSFRRRYLKELGIRRTSGIRVAPQRSYGQNSEDRPDLTLRGRDVFILQENKIDSPGTAKQIRRYAQRLEKECKKLDFKGQRLLVYMTKNAPESKITAVEYRDIICVQWNLVARLLKESLSPLNSVDNRSRWLREEIYNFLEESDMAPPNPINPKVIDRHWPLFEPQRQTLIRINKDAVRRLKTSLTVKGFSCNEDSQSDKLGLYVIARSGKLKKPMDKEWVWVWGGISTYDGAAYVDVGIGGDRDLTETIPERVRKLLKTNGFAQVAETGGPAYWKSKPLKGLVGTTKTYEAQSKKVSDWMAHQIDFTLKALAAMKKNL